jgi:hypothetical protein
MFFLETFWLIPQIGRPVLEDLVGGLFLLDLLEPLVALECLL